ncbi:MAG: efflux RND transporter periplasmic adaptor subunit [Spirochaetales bacterium]|jgi:multidrug efflux pump subunit AcrA (membrane-fusion protein)|nr:efflux RND transporter periplasmic adaptor subunit [Spirochaetales bacterium]
MYVATKKILLLYWLFAASCPAFLSSCRSGKLPDKGASAAQVSLVRPELRRFDNDLISFGSMLYKTKNNIVAQVEGALVDLRVKEGDSVGQNQILGILKNVQLEIQQEQNLNAVKNAQAALQVSLIRLNEEELSAESRLLSLERDQISLEQKEKELAALKETYEHQTQLFALGGLTEAAYKNLGLSLSSLESETAALKKQMEISSLGFRDQDLAAAGFPPETGDARRRQFIELNTQSAAAEVEAARTGIRTAENNLASVNRLIDELTLRSRVAGVVGALNFESGEYVPQNEAFATVIDISTVYAVFSVQERDMVNFSLQSPLTLEIPSLNSTLNAVIDEISPLVDPQTGNFTIKAEVRNPGGEIRPGMFVKCRLPRTEDRFYPAIPETALTGEETEAPAVFCAINGLAVLKPLQIFGRRDGWVWVAEGLSEGDRVIDRPSLFLKEGAHVEEI